MKRLTRAVRFATLMTVAPLVPAALLWSHYRNSLRRPGLDADRSELFPIAC